MGAGRRMSESLKTLELLACVGVSESESGIGILGFAKERNQDFELVLIDACPGVKPEDLGNFQNS